VDWSSSSAAQSAAEVSAALTPRTAELSAAIYDLLVREIPPLRIDRQVLALLEASVSENVATLLHVIQHGIEMENVSAPAAAQEYARRLAQRGVPIAALLRAYRIGSALFQEWCLEELGRSTDDASVISRAALRIAEVTAAYIDRVSEELVSAYETEKENWLRNLSVTRGARVRAVLRGERVDLDSSEAVLGYRLRQHHVGVVCWADGKAQAGGDVLPRLEQATGEVARRVGCRGRPIFLPQDESSAWAWLPLGAEAGFPVQALSTCSAHAEPGIRFALGAAGSGVSGFRRTHQQALGAHAVALAAGPSGQVMTTFADVAPLALMSGSIELVRAWVAETLGDLADDDEHNSVLRGTLRVFLQEGGSFKATAERLTLHKNTVQYRVRKARQGLGRPADEDRLQVELALLATQWLGPAVLRAAGTSRP
jgi:PucR C-terminal helix-turn-helix domain/GGDEF-like domain